MTPAKLWPVAIVGVLAVTVAANFALLRWASGPEAAAIEPDYYGKAVRWDSTLAERAHDAALGWRIDATLGAPAPGGMPLTVRLAGAGGEPLAGATITVEAIHNAEPARRPRVAVRETRRGGYAATIPLARAGLWELRFDVRHGGEHFTATLRREAGR